MGEQEDPWDEKMTEQQLTQVSHAPLGSPLEAIWAVPSLPLFLLPLSPLAVKSGYSRLRAWEINESKVVPAANFLQFSLWSL